MRNHTLNISPDGQVTSDKICLGKVATIYSKTGLLWEATYNPNGFGAISQYFKNQDAALDFLVGVHEKNKRAEALRELEQDILEIIPAKLPRRSPRPWARQPRLYKLCSMLFARSTKVTVGTSTWKMRTRATVGWAWLWICGCALRRFDAPQRRCGD
jgi:hypothetical protein